MRQAWTERQILKHLNMQMKDYSVQLQDSEGRILEFTASEMAELADFDQRCVRQQLRWNEDYVAPLVREFATTLQTKMSMAPGQHQGLVFAATTEHANHLERVFARFHPSLRCAVIHSGDITDAENDRRLKDFHNGRYDVLVQVRKASEGFDAPSVSVLLKLDAVFSREPVIQQLGRGLRYNHNLPEAENMLNIFVGRDPRLGPIIEHLEREAPLPAIARRGQDGNSHRDPVEDDSENDAFEDEEPPRLEITDVVEAGDAYLDHTGRFIEGQQLTLFGGGGTGGHQAVNSRLASSTRVQEPANPEIDVFDLAAELQQAVDFCKLWTNRAAKERARKLGGAQNHHAALNLTYGQASGKRGALSTAAEYRAKGEWMKRQYEQILR
jgi:superfamily II DNA/RNA helicase